MNALNAAATDTGALLAMIAAISCSSFVSLARNREQIIRAYRG